MTALSDADRAAGDAQARSIAASLKLPMEQGPILDNEGAAVGIRGRRRATDVLLGLMLALANN